MGIEKAAFNRTELLLGADALEKLRRAKVIIFGAGGVGSWCAEGLVRSGVSNITIVDSDRVCITNINRQLQATVHTVGVVKVEALKIHLLSINPSANITAIQQIYDESSSGSYDFNDYDYVIDCIDSLKDKALLIIKATSSNCRFYSSMGAALKLDPTKIKISEFWNVKGCPLARALRQRFKKRHEFPAKKFICVYSDELLENKGKNSGCGTDKCVCPKSTDGPGDSLLLNHEWCSAKATINGTVMHITAMFGLTLSGLVIQDRIK